MTVYQLYKIFLEMAILDIPLMILTMPNLSQDRVILHYVSAPLRTAFLPSPSLVSETKISILVHPNINISNQLYYLFLSKKIDNSKICR